MSLARARAVQSLRNGLRQSARPSMSRGPFSRTQLQAKRFASSGHGQQSSSDIPWLIGASVITPVSCWFLWPSSSDEHGDDHHSVGSDDKTQFEGQGLNKFQKEHAEKYAVANEDNEEVTANASKVSGEDEEEDDEGKGEEGEKKEGDEGKGDEGDKKEDGADSDDKDGDDAKSDGDDSTKTQTSKDVGKGKVKADSDAAKQDVKVESDSKGANKKRLDSGLQKNLGPEASSDDDSDNSTAKKQDGVANTQTRHSEPIDESNEKSKKPDGTPETSKHIGTVDGDKGKGSK